MEADLFIKELGRDPSNRDAWGRFFDSMWPFMIVVARKYADGIGGSIEAEDLVQEALIKLSQGLHEKKIELQDEKTCKSLLAIILHRLAIDQSRKTSKRIVTEPFSKLEGIQGTFEAIASHIKDIAWSDLMQFLSYSLSADEMAILELRLQGYGNDEIATKLNVHSRTISRKTRNIREIVEEYARD